MSSSVRRTYGARPSSYHRSSSSSELSSSLNATPIKRALPDPPSIQNWRTAKRPRLDPLDLPVVNPKPTVSSRAQGKRNAKLKSKTSTLTQLHLALDSTALRTCAKCGLTYTRGVPADESLHKAHCTRVHRGAEWGREEERDSARAGVMQIEGAVKLRDGRKGRIVSVRADVGGKVGSKIAVLLETISLCLSSPPLDPDILRASKIYLFFLPSGTSSSRETIAGCVIARRITCAMELVRPDDTAQVTSAAVPTPPPTATLVPVDLDAGLFCYPKPLPTPLGISRIFVPSAFRRLGVASKLLDAAAATFLHGCKLSPQDGDVAFTQPTSLGQALMESWGGGKVRVYQE
ncbi:hypothetical protein K488DRAFT_42730 [Vararia minispora EC-137]|uniref:Uncharacterized protein n=1 Tax=Vararia minispora EC-137 TaxID=1314806 RepID=A0ACB8QVN2_9AGAM|nr:hypothetical protein K488DRAFT_42730 [Vararia minispora EC-137]